jgi:outer membrane lipoprotein LolB
VNNHLNKAVTRRLFIPLIAIVLSVSACTTVPSLNETETNATRTYAEHIAISGRLSLRYEVRGSNQSSHGSFSWEQNADNTSIQLRSPLGQTVAVIEMNAQQARLLRGGQPAIASDNADTLIQEVLGWPLPIGGLKNWLQGFVLGATGQLVAVKPSDAAVTVNTIDGWQIQYQQWQADQDHSLHPKRIDLTRYTEEAGTVMIRIVIDEWRTH